MRAFSDKGGKQQISKESFWCKLSLIYNYNHLNIAVTLLAEGRGDDEIFGLACVIYWGPAFR